jgi:diguanylate cyclase (GGDEF)-like protein
MNNSPPSVCCGGIRSATFPLPLPVPRSPFPAPGLPFPAAHGCANAAKGRTPRAAVSRFPFPVPRSRSPVSDTYGHRAGDRVLSTVAKHLSTRIRRTDFVAHYGGEEFVMLLPGTTLQDALNLIDDLRDVIGKIGFHFRGAPVSVTISVGATALMHDDSVGGAFDRADKALYRAKEMGRNRCVSS